MGAGAGFIFGLIYIFILGQFGIQLKYIPVVGAIGIPVFISALFGTEIGGVAIAVFFIGIFIVAIGMLVKQTMDSVTPNVSVEAHRIPVLNYYGVAFHVVITVMVALSIFTYSENPVLSAEKMDLLMADMMFQFSSTLILIIIGIFNPFLPPSDKMKALAQKIDKEKYPAVYRYLQTRIGWVIIKLLLCILLISILFYKGLIFFPVISRDSDYMNIVVLMIGLFVFFSLVQLIRTPHSFFSKNILRIKMLFRSAFVSVFVSAILVVITMFATIALGGDINRLQVRSETILFLGFNIVMGLVEFKVARSANS